MVVWFYSPDDFQLQRGMRATGNFHYITIPFSDKMYKTFAIFQAYYY